MTPQKGPAYNRRLLGFELRRLREVRTWTCNEVGEKLEWSGVKVGRIETARTSVDRPDLRRMLDLYEVTDEADREALLQLISPRREKAWWNGFRDVLPERKWVYVRLEDEAEEIRGYEPEYIPGLLQTEDYARTCLRLVRPADTAEAIERRVALRMGRQQLLTREHAPRFKAIINEGALLRVAAMTPKVAVEQLLRLVEMSKLPNVTIQVLPFSVGPHPAMDGAFSILTFPDPAGELVYIESLTGPPYRDDPREIEGYGRAFDSLRTESLGTQQSRKRIMDLIGENG